MKNKPLLIFLFAILIACPIYANTPYEVILNGINYTPKLPIYEVNKMLYVSIDDLMSLTYGKLTSDSASYTLYIQNNSIRFKAEERIVSVNQKSTVITHAPLLLNENLFIPINLLDSIKYPYALNKEKFRLTLNAIPPYSKTTDSYKDHLLMNTSIENIPLTLKKLLSEAKAIPLLENAKKNNSYISFIDNTDKDNLLKLISSHSLNNKPMQVKFREIDLLSLAAEVSVLKELPMKIQVTNNKLTAEIGDDLISYNCIWAAYKPDDKDLKIDVSKSLDATLMRMLYEYYRDQHDLKDDLYFSPAVTIKTGRADSIVYTAYYDYLMDQKGIYDIIIYRTNDEKYITYTIDFLLHQ
jgi:hypothetical protein